MITLKKDSYCCLLAWNQGESVMLFVVVAILNPYTWCPLCREGGGHCIEDTGHWLIIEMFVSDSSPLGLAPTTQIRSTTTQQGEGGDI